ncbi:uncharacterized protein [Montipora foliosa]|uniref:uncharacterized protein isoform X2 n=1 Tax=Montipora foliosa TaxID=591990 RepID=UPI0035F1C923
MESNANLPDVGTVVVVGKSGVLHTNVPCNGCKKQAIEGIRWECCDCGNYNLCSLCYMNDKHVLDHGFNRVEAQGKPGVFVVNRREKCKVQARGIFPGAQEVCSGSCADGYLSHTPEHEALNSVVPDSGIEEHSFLSASSAPSGCIGLHEKLEGDLCESSDVALANSCLAKAQNKQETKDMHQYAEVCQFKSEEEDPDNCDSMDDVVRRPESNMASEEGFRELNECSALHIAPDCHPQCLSTFEEMEVSVAKGIGVRAPRNSGLDPFVLSNSPELQEEINELKEQLRQREAENQTLKAKLGRHQFLEDREKRWGTPFSEPRTSASDESRCCGASTSFKCVSTNGRILGGAVSLQDKPDFNLQARFIGISNSLSPEEFKQMKILARGKVDGFRLAKMKVGFEVLKEVERVSEHPCTDIGELLKGIQRFDLLEKLGLPSPESKTSESAGISSDSLPLRDERLQDLEQVQGGERCTTLKSSTSTIGFAHKSEDNGEKFTSDNDFDLSASVPFESDSGNPVSINIEDNDPLSMEGVGTSDKKGICVPNSPDQSGPSSGTSSICVSSSDSLALCTAEGTPVCSSSISQGSSEKSEKAPEVALTTHSAAAPGEIACENNLNTGSGKEEVPGQTQLLNSTDGVTGVGNTEFENIEGPSVNRTSPLFEYDSQISSSDSSVFCRLADPVSSLVLDGNPHQLQQSSSAHGQTALEMHGSDAARSSSAEWGRLGARPKNSQTQRPQVAVSPPRPPLIASPVSDGLAGDLLVRHSQDKAVLESLYTNDGNPLQLRQSSSALGQATLGMHGSDAGSSSSAEWERLGSRPKNSQTQRPQVAVSPPPPPLIASPVSDGLAGNFLVRHSQDKAVLESLYTNDRDFSFLGNHTLQRTSFVDGKSNAPEACRVRPYLGACQAAVGNISYVRSDGSGFSHVLSGGFERTGLLGGNSYNESLYGNSAPAAAVPLPSHTGTNDIEPVNDSLLALERRVADASAIVERLLREREEREQFEREIERKERMIREGRERERREREEREIQKAERWPQQQEAVSVHSPWLCEHYQRQCRVRFPCCTQFYPCHRCHITSRNCENEEAKACHATHLKCSFCQHEQEIDGSSGVCGKCVAKMGKNPYHCEKCGICRVHAGSLDERREGNYKCRPESCHDKCCICLEDAFSGCQILPCSHRVHRECAMAIIQNGIRTCPVCRHPLYSTPSE